MIIKKTFSNGNDQKGGKIIFSTKIPVIEYNQIIQTKSSVKTIVASLNEKENLYSYKQKNSLIWKICQHCQTIFLSWKKKSQKYCSKKCNGYYRGQEWKKWGKIGASKVKNRNPLFGKDNPAWKGGVTYFKSSIFYSTS